MRPFGAPREFPPSWIDELREAATWPNKPWTPAHHIDCVTAVAELHAWVESPRPYKTVQKQGWLSIIDDFCHSVGEIGAALRSELGAELTDALSVAHGIESILQSAGKSSVDSLLAQRKAVDRHVLEKLRTRWSDMSIVVAGWDDLIAACRDSASSYDLIAARRDLFWQLIRSSGYSAGNMGRLLAGVLDDHEPDVINAQLQLGDIQESEIDGLNVGELFGLSENQRLDICRRLLKASPMEAHHVVWLAFDRASLRSTIVQMGPISFYHSDWVRANLDPDSPNRTAIPPELVIEGSLFSANNLPEESDVVLARIDLGRGIFTDPVQVAKEQVDAVLALASFDVGENRWRQREGYLSALDGRIRGMSMFVEPFDDESLSRPAFLDRMSDELEELEARLVPHLPVKTETLAELAKAIRWWQEAKTGSPLAAVLMHVRILELITARLGYGFWQDYVDDQLTHSWIRHLIHWSLYENVRQVTHHTNHDLPDENQERIDEIRKSIFTYRSVGERANLRKALAELSALADALPTFDARGRRVRALRDQLSSVPTLVAWRDEVEDEWKRVLNRARRVRNSLAHGGPLNDSMIESVQGIVQQLAAWALSFGLEGALDGRGMATSHSENRQKMDAWYVSMSTATDVEGALFGT